MRLRIGGSKKTKEDLKKKNDKEFGNKVFYD